MKKRRKLLPYYQMMEVLMNRPVRPLDLHYAGNVVSEKYGFPRHYLTQTYKRWRGRNPTADLQNYLNTEDTEYWLDWEPRGSYEAAQLVVAQAQRHVDDPDLEPASTKVDTYAVTVDWPGHSGLELQEMFDILGRWGLPVLTVMLEVDPTLNVFEQTRTYHEMVDELKAHDIHVSEPVKVP